MEFNDTIRNIANRVNSLKDSINTEEATKNAFIMPFLQALGYDVFNPTEVVPEYVTDIGTKKGETSMCVTNALFGALGLMAASQCTMNNFTFGNERHQYYETISGGTGAGVWTDAEGGVTGGFDGTSVVQAHMTNSRLTDPEVLEFRFPVRLDSYEIRAGSGGAGRWRGGDGGVRRVRFLEPMTASILSNGRDVPAFGLAGGAPGALGINRLERADGRVEMMRHIGSAHMQAGDVFVIETPGGGGWGAAAEGRVEALVAT